MVKEKEVSPFGKKILEYLSQNFEGIHTQTALAKAAEISQSSLSKIIDGNRSGAGRAGIKIAKKIGLPLETYVELIKPEGGQLICTTTYGGITPTPIQPSDFGGVYAYDIPTGVTYIGKPDGATLKEACIIQTISVANESYKSGDSLKNILRRVYTQFQNKGKLSNIEKFSPLEQIAVTRLG